MNRTLLIKFVYIDNTFIYKIRDFIKDKNQKNVIDFNQLLDKTIEKTDTLNNRVLVGSIILKRLKKILTRHSNEIQIYYVLNKLDDVIINTVVTNTKSLFDGDINYEIYTDIKVNKPNYFLIDKINDCR